MADKDDVIRRAERALAVRFPVDYSTWLRDNDGMEGDLGGCYLALYAVDVLVQRNRDYAVADHMPGLLLIGTDGGGEAIGLDVRGEAAAVVMVNLNALRWDQAVHQAGSFQAFLDDRRGGRPFLWDTR